MFLRILSTLACTVLLATTMLAQDEATLSPPATASVMLGGKAIKITYNTPSIRGRTIMGGLVPYGEVWRTGANPATTIIIAADLMIGTLKVPAGTYTIYTLPSATDWQLIVNKQTKQWGTEYHQDQDLGRVPMMKKDLGTPKEVMSISFENTSGTKTDLHVKWEKTDVFVPVSLAK
ncbi:DUF2911 domain-containing protein [Granulicella sibirica]|uniref:DUF2911 domain-containing protein n=1 Tax=Granulicella sibirica TaxID=2479048 RepID=A0A4Q0T310_9BACT|nr:DUF2911 domain-containing protein [Granulicella sibirica]RXH57637.1 hypothetical protein GRAN_0947 [Granulicella sibirica]